MRKFSKRLAVCLTLLVLIITIYMTGAAPVNIMELDFSLEKVIGEEIIVLLDREADEYIVADLSSAPCDLELIEYQYDYMLLRTDISMVKECLSYLNSLDYVLTAELNQEISLSWVSNSIQYVQQLQAQHISINTSTRKEVIVAVLDTGIDYNHPDLKSYIWMNKNEIDSNGLDDDGNGYIDDIYGWDFYNNDATVCHYIIDDNGNQIADPNDNDNHGTHCAGIISSVSNAGINNIKIMTLKIHGGKDGKGSIANAIKAIRYACMMGADICNMSWGTSIYSEALEQVMRESDMLFVTASGNEGKNVETNPIYPACFDLDNMIVAAFTDDEGKIAYDSNYSSIYVDIGAPGVDISSTIVGSYGIMMGSSMAAPYTSGVAAILYSGGRNMYPSDVKDVLLSSLISSSVNEGYIAYPGILDPVSIHEYRNLLKKDTLPPRLDIETVYDKDTLLLLLSSSDAKGSGARVIKYAQGLKQIHDFKKGTAGTSVKSDRLELSKSGQYTFYISDYAGNEALYYYTVHDDTDPPVISASHSLTANKSFYAVAAVISDEKSGVKLVKYMKGDKNIDNFRSSSGGMIIESYDGIIYSFTVETPGIYTIYALDYRGNSSVYTINIPETTAEVFNLNEHGKMLSVGSQYQLTYNMLPKGAKDLITYKSSKPSIASVNHNGVITALSPGLTTITASTSKGLISQCLIFVTYDSVKRY